MNILIIGASSAIAQATARCYAQAGTTFFLLARDAEKLELLAGDLRVRGANVFAQTLDVSQIDAHEAVIEQVFVQLERVDIALLAYGTLPDQVACERDFSLARQEIELNAISKLSLLSLLANRLELQGAGVIAAITSVAGDRGRQSNYVYGASKAMVSVFLQGLRNRLHKLGVAVVDIKPGFVDTPMTAQFDKGLLWAQPETVAAGIVKAINKKKAVVYLPGFWRWVMWVIRNIPERIFIRLSL
jgi:decaprenylphospho-beta-D-erythro-pentofuranosid-2-ulose 2-reductase